MITKMYSFYNKQFSKFTSCIFTNGYSRRICKYMNLSEYTSRLYVAELQDCLCLLLCIKCTNWISMKYCLIFICIIDELWMALTFITQLKKLRKIISLCNNKFSIACYLCVFVWIWKRVREQVIRIPWGSCYFFQGSVLAADPWVLQQKCKCLLLLKTTNVTLASSSASSDCSE